MRKKRHSTEEVVRKLREAEAAFAEGKTVAQVCQALAISEQTYHRWKQRYGGMGGDGVRELRRLEEENRRLKKAVADLTVDNQILKEVNRGKW
jgi:transposase-like protein